MYMLACFLFIFSNIFLRFQGLIKNQTSTGKELSGMTLRDLWENSPNAINKPLAHIEGGLSVSRANAGEQVRQKVRLTVCSGDTRNATGKEFEIPIKPEMLSCRDTNGRTPGSF